MAVFRTFVNAVFRRIFILFEQVFPRKFLRDKIETAPAKRVAAQNPAKSHYGAPYSPEFFYGLERVLRAGGVEAAAAARHQMYDWRNRRLVEFQKQYADFCKDCRLILFHFARVFLRKPKSPFQTLLLARKIRICKTPCAQKPIYPSAFRRGSF